MTNNDKNMLETNGIKDYIINIQMYNILFRLRNKCTLYKINNKKKTLQKGLDCRFYFILKIYS